MSKLILETLKDLRKDGRLLEASYGVRDYTEKLLAELESGNLDWETVARECLSYMSEDDVEDMCRVAGFIDEEDLDEDFPEDEIDWNDPFDDIDYDDPYEDEFEEDEDFEGQAALFISVDFEDGYYPHEIEHKTMTVRSLRERIYGLDDNMPIFLTDKDNLTCTLLAEGRIHKGKFNTSGDFELNECKDKKPLTEDKKFPYHFDGNYITGYLSDFDGRELVDSIKRTESAQHRDLLVYDDDNKKVFVTIVMSLSGFDNVENPQKGVYVDIIKHEHTRNDEYDADDWRSYKFIEKQERLAVESFDLYEEAVEFINRFAKSYKG